MNAEQQPSELHLVDEPARIDDRDSRCVNLGANTLSALSRGRAEPGAPSRGLAGGCTPPRPTAVGVITGLTPT
ncbi:MAG: hypothetical protein M3N47_12865, partial [Chloroflexota bacterium]|nr:hypothetical protein [Chloroflexota bacterium]